MLVNQFRNTLSDLQHTPSRNEKEAIIRTVGHSTAAISFLSGEEYDDAGLGKKTVLSAAQAVFGDAVDGKPTVSESLEEFDVSETPDSFEQDSLSSLRQDMQVLAEQSGNEQKSYLMRMLNSYHYPSVVSHACLNDLPTGCSDKTIANALDIRECLPFYDGVVDAVQTGEYRTAPTIGEPFDPQLAKSESSLPEDKQGLVAQPKLDGYRLIIHLSEHSSEQKVTAFTRRKNDVTESLPELQEIDWPDGQYIIDCEVIAADGSYQTTSERIGRKADTVSRDVEMHFGLFDVLVFDNSRVHDRSYKERYGLTTAFADLTPDDRVGALPIFTDEAQAKAVATDYEGLIWKKLDAPYEFGKRSTNWIKEKHTAERVDLVATEFVEGEGRLDGTMGKILLETADGTQVGSTGSGFSDAQRDEVWENRDEYLGATIEVEAEAFGERGSLRFPIFQRWRTDDGEPDSLDRVKEILPET